ncbi:MAG: cytochrome c [Methylibium sp.]|nr:cytochrome c [Methylibium sp.]
MTRGRALAVSVLLACTGPALNAQSLGRQAAPRAKAESVAVTTSVRSQYVVHCAGCHGLDGAGSHVGNVPDMRKLGHFLRVPGGREFVIRVPGVMGSGLSDQQVADVTNWVLTTLAPASLPVDHVPYDAAEVQRARADPLVDVAAARAGLLDEARRLAVPLD